AGDARARGARPTWPRRPSPQSPRRTPRRSPPRALLLPPDDARLSRRPRRRLLRLAVVAFATVAVALLLRRRTRRSLLLRRRLRPRRQATSHEPLAHGPEIRRHPVEDEARREARDHGQEGDRQHHHDPALRLVHR